MKNITRPRNLVRGTIEREFHIEESYYIDRHVWRVVSPSYYWGKWYDNRELAEKERKRLMIKPSH